MNLSAYVNGNLADRLRDAIRNHILTELSTDSGGELEAKTLGELLIAYGNWRARFVPQRPRTVHRSNELDANSKSSEHEEALGTITAAIEIGDNITPYLSERVMTAYQSTASRSAKLQKRQDLDLLIADWGIHHFHLSTVLQSNGFVQRTSDLLFAAFMPGDAYFIDIRPHDSWTDVDLLSCVVHNWPAAGIVHQLAGLGLAAPIGADQRRKLRNAGIAGIIEIDGKVFAPAGQTTAGTPIRVTLHANQVMNVLNWLDRTLTDNPHWFDQELRAAGVDASEQDDWQPVISDGVFGFLEQVRHIHYPIGSLIL